MKHTLRELLGVFIRKLRGGGALGPFKIFEYSIEAGEPLLLALSKYS